MSQAASDLEHLAYVYEGLCVKMRMLLRMHVYVLASVRLPICLSTNLFVYQSVYIYMCIYIYMPVYLPLSLSVSLSLYLCLYICL